MGSALRFLDAIGVAAVSLLVWAIGVRQNHWPGPETQSSAVLFSGALFFYFLLVSVRLRAYRPRRTEHMRQELFSLLELVLVASSLACLTVQLVAPRLPASYFAYSLCISSMLGLLLRLLMRSVIRTYRRRGEDYRVWLVVGDNARSRQLVREVTANPHFGIRIAEIVDLPPSDARGTARNETGPTTSNGHRVLSGTDEVREIVSSRVIDEVVVMLPHRSHYEEIERIIGVCTEAGISVMLTPQSFENTACRYHVSEVASIPLVTHFTGPSSYLPLILKRLIDVAVSALGLLILSPLFALIAVAIRLDSPGPILFRQIRLGLHGRRFYILKFRSMIPNAHALQESLREQSVTDGVAFKIRRDPRVTRVGYYLRKFHLDEVPQLWNVLVGDMSLVGPRPLPPNEAAGNEWWQRRRLTMPPGLTCFWQVQGDHEMPFREWVELDLQYIDRWSVWLDLKLIASTIPVVVRGRGY